MPGHKPKEAAGADDSAPLISAGKLKRLYAAMLKCRLLGQHEPPFRSPAVGDEESRAAGPSEAVVAGCIVGLRPKDTVISSPYVHAPAVARGFPPDEHLFNHGSRPPEPLGRASSTKSRPSKLQPFTIGADSGAEFGIAAGIALANQAHKNERIVMLLSFAGPPAPNPMLGSLRLCRERGLPAIFVTRHKLESASAWRKGQRSAFATEVCEIPAINVDAFDVIAVHRVAHEAIVRARLGAGPTLIRCIAEESGVDSISFMEDHLKQKGIWRDRLREEIKDAFMREMNGVARSSKDRVRRRRG